MSNNANREIIVYGDAFYDFYNKQNQKVRAKIDWTIGVIRDMERISEKYLKHMEGTKDLYEMRVSHGSNIFRIFCFFDKGKLVILLNGFQKKSQKTPKQQIERALELQKQYYEQKK